MKNTEKQVDSKLTQKFALANNNYGQTDTTWGMSDRPDILEFADSTPYSKLVDDCRFYYKKDSLASTVINKVVAIAINGLIFKDITRNYSKTEKAVFEQLMVDIVPFLRQVSLSYLVSGLAIPEITFTEVDKEFLELRGIKYYNQMMYPTEMWLRDSASIIIKRPLIGSGESYFLKIPDEIKNFIETKGEYPDGTEDKELYRKIVQMYPDFVRAVRKGEDTILLDNPLIIKGETTVDDPYPVPYLNAALEPLRHKRNLRRMDYSIASRVISAVLHVKVGNDIFPLTEDDETTLTALEDQFKWRDKMTPDVVDRVCTLFTNHTVDMAWVFPEVDSMLDQKKYEAVNQDIMVAMGFPRILITGETERSFTSDPEVATLSPIYTMEALRSQLQPIIRAICYNIYKFNSKIKTIPEFVFKPISLMSLRLFYEGLNELYNTGNLSRKSYAEAYGFDLVGELEQRSEEQELFDILDIEEVAPSNVPGANAPAAPPVTKTKTKKPKTK